MLENSPEVQGHLFTLDCGHYPTETEGCGTGYGRDNDGKEHCYECCAVNDLKAMIEAGRATLYLCDGDNPKPSYPATKYKVTNWPGTLKFPVRAFKTGGHNMGGTRIDVWFRGPDEKGEMTAIWWGKMIGKFTQICHCRRTKERI